MKGGKPASGSSFPQKHLVETQVLLIENILMSVPLNKIDSEIETEQMD